MKADPPASAEAAIDWGDLQFFIAVAEGGSISEAARRLGVNHSTVLRRVARLERALACRLFDRLPGGYALTARGNALSGQMAGLSEQVDTLQRQLNGLDPAVEGVIRISSNPVVAEGLLMPLLAQFRHRHPRVRFQLVMNDSVTMPTHQRADIAVHDADSAPHGMVAHRVGEIDIVVGGSKAYLERAGSGVPLAQHRWVAVDALHSPHWQEDGLRHHAASERITLRIDSLLGAADAVAAGMGLALLPAPLLRTRPQIMVLRSGEPGLRRPLWVMMHPDVQHTARMRVLFDFLCERLALDVRRAHDPR